MRQKNCNKRSEVHQYCNIDVQIPPGTRYSPVSTCSWWAAHSWVMNQWPSSERRSLVDGGGLEGSGMGTWSLSRSSSLDRVWNRGRWWVCLWSRRLITIVIIGVRVWLCSTLSKEFSKVDSSCIASVVLYHQGVVAEGRASSFVMQAMHNLAAHTQV